MQKIVNVIALLSGLTSLAVIGGGPGGYTAAFLAADMGMEVTLIDLNKNPNFFA